MRSLNGKSVIVVLVTLLANASMARAQELEPALRTDIIKLIQVSGAGHLATEISEQALEAFRKARPDLPERAFVLTAPAAIPPRFLGDTMDRVRSMPFS